jgi:dipeptidyl aminopeptidase/acylaminoacyl peptidase
LLASVSTAVCAQSTLDARRYEHAARFLIRNEDAQVLNRTVTPHWRDDGGENFTYLQERGGGKAGFVRVDAATGRRSEPFDSKIIATGLASVLGKPVDAERLPFKDYDRLGTGAIRFLVDAATYTCSTSKASCTLQASVPTDPLAIPSPDGKWLAFGRDNNLWIRPAAGGDAFALTNDGCAHYAYAGTPESNPLVTEKVMRGMPVAPVLVWSPDSSHLYTQRLDERDVRQMAQVQSVPVDGTVQPKVVTWRYPMSTDAVLPVSEPWVFDVSARQGHRIAMDPIPAQVTSSIESKEVWWSRDGRHVYVFARPRYNKSMALYEVDAATGAARTVVQESGKTFVEAGSIGQRPMVYTLANGKVIWFSERDGHGHLYLYDGASGRLERQLTQGDWSVKGVLYLDEAGGVIYVAGNGREAVADPYYRKVYRVGLADGRTSLLTPEDADHLVTSAQESAFFEPPPNMVRSVAASQGFSPTGRYFLDTYSRADLPAETALRRADGKLISIIERADVSRVLAGGLTAPERFSALAADGKTLLYGHILRPSDFDATKQYPVIDSMYPGPQARKAYPRYLDIVFGYTADQTLAELGFVVIQVDGRGTPGRSKTFLDESYGKLGQAGHLDDHVAVIRELARRYPYMDLQRVGAYGGSAGGYAALRAMLVYPDFYKVGVSAAGSHDLKTQLASYSENFLGPDDGTNYRAAANAPLAGNLKGKLLLLHGETDWTVLPGNTLQVVDALIKNNKDFDFLLLPNVGHSPLGVHGGYALRRTWDYLVENLMGMNPPVLDAFPAPLPLQ